MGKIRERGRYMNLTSALNQSEFFLGPGKGKSNYHYVEILLPVRFR